MSAPRPYDVILAGYFGFGNLGDELIAESAVRQLQDLGVERARIAVLTADCELSRQALGIAAYDRGLRSLMRGGTLKLSKSVLFAGGGIFQDSTSVRSAVYYWFTARLAAASSCKLWALGQSVGPLRSGVSKFLTKDALRRFVYVGSRDRRTVDLLDGYGISSELTPDTVMGLSIPETAAVGNTILLNARPASDGSCAERFIAAIESAAALGFDMRGIALCAEDVDELKRLTAAAGIPNFEISLLKTSADFVTASEGACAAIGMRLHFGVLSYMRGLNVALIPYDPKVEGFASRNGIELLSDCKSEKISVIIASLKNEGVHAKRVDGCINAQDEVRAAFRRGLDLALGER